MFIERDIILVYYVFDKKVGFGNFFYVQKLYFGWIIIGKMCLEKVFCDNDIYVKESFVEMIDVVNVKSEFGKNIF